MRSGSGISRTRFVPIARLLNGAKSKPEPKKSHSGASTAGTVSPSTKMRRTHLCKAYSSRGLVLSVRAT